MKLWLDDIRAAPSDWIHVTTAAAAIGILEHNQVDEISLDHDLGEESQETGYTVILWLENQVMRHDYVPPTIYIHTANPVARKRMERARDQIIAFLGKSK